MMDLNVGLHTALDNYIERSTWTLSSSVTNLYAFKERARLNITFDIGQMFGIKNEYIKNGGIPDWKRQLLLTEDGYKSTLDVLLDAHNMFLKLNNKLPHRLDVMIPSLQAAPMFHKHEEVNTTRWSERRPQKVRNENRLIATQATDAGAGMRDRFWMPSLALLDDKQVA